MVKSRIRSYRVVADDGILFRDFSGGGEEILRMEEEFPLVYGLPDDDIFI